MSEQNQAPTAQGPVTTGIIVQNRTEIIHQMIHGAMTEHLSAGTPRLGVKLSYMIKLVVTHRLTKDEVDQIIYTRSKGYAKVATFRRYLLKDCSVQEIYTAIEAREEIQTATGCSVSIGKVIRFIRQFESLLSADDGESVADAVLKCCEAFGEAVGRYLYPDQVISAVCKTARDHQIVSYEEVLDLMQKG